MAATTSGAKRATAGRRRTRLARGPLTIGEPAPVVQARLATPEPYRPDTVADGGCAFGLTVRAASVRGLYKRHVGAPRQDDLCLRPHPPTGSLIVAVADGVSAATRSDLAAALSVRQAAASVARQLERQPVDLDWAEVFQHAAWALVEEHRRACGDPAAGIDEAAVSLATTLIVAVITPADHSAVSDADPQDGRRRASFDVRAAAVGDSPALLLRDGMFQHVVGETASTDGLLAGGVRALPRDREISEGSCMLERPGVLLICTDGLALPLADGTGEVGHTLARELANPPDIVDFARLLDFSRATYDDDRTLIAVWARDEHP